MRSTFTKISVLLLLVGVVYTSCNKSSNKPATTSNTDVLARQLATSLYKSLTGNYGVASFNKTTGKFSITTNAVQLKNKRVHNLANALCSFADDTTFTYPFNLGDTTSTVTGSVKLFYSCSGDTVNGYTVSDTMKTVGSVSGSTAYNFVNLATQDYAVKALDSTYLKVSMNGAITSYIVNTGGLASQNATSYLLTGLVVTVNPTTYDLDIVSGVSNYTMTGVQGGSSFNFTGSITYLGNHEARIVMNINANTQKTYLCNMVTGQLTEQ
jgi:hypothetical protein